jgi:putative membrane protein
VNSVLGVAPTTADFVKEAALSDMTEIATSKLAQERGDADAKTFAGQMITDHTKTSEELKALVGGGVKAEMPSALDDAHQKMVDKLKAAKAEDFTADYASMQVSAHKDAVSLFERYAKGGEDPKLKDWAGKTLPHLQHHLRRQINSSDLRAETLTCGGRCPERRDLDLFSLALSSIGRCKKARFGLIVLCDSSVISQSSGEISQTCRIRV